MRARVRIGRPVLYFGVAAVLALVCTLLVSGPAAVAPPAPAQAAAGLTTAACPNPPPAAAPPGTTRAAIAARGYLVAGVDQTKRTTAFRDPQTLALKGADIDIVRSIAAGLLGDANRVHYVAVDIADRGAALNRPVGEGGVDVIVNDFTVSPERERCVAFSRPYRSTAQYLMVAGSSDVVDPASLGNRPVCTSVGSSALPVLAELRLNVVTARSVSDCAVRLLDDQVAAVASDDGILAGLILQNPQLRVVGPLLGPVDQATGYAVGMPPGQADLVADVDAVLDRGRAAGSLEASTRYWRTPGSS